MDSKISVLCGFLTGSNHVKPLVIMLLKCCEMFSWSFKFQSINPILQLWNFWWLMKTDEDAFVLRQKLKWLLARMLSGSSWTFCLVRLRQLLSIRFHLNSNCLKLMKTHQNFFLTSRLPIKQTWTLSFQHKTTSTSSVSFMCVAQTRLRWVYLISQLAFSHENILPTLSFTT